MNSPQLILMRHAKSDWADHSLCDADRPLNKRGRRDAPRMADWLASIGCVPERILCSSALRTRQTADRLLGRWHEQGVERQPDVIEADQLYLAGIENLLRTIQADNGCASCLMVLAHNPGLSHLAGMLAGEACELVTAAAVVFVLKQQPTDHGDALCWDHFSVSTAMTLEHGMHPKGLPDDLTHQAASDAAHWRQYSSDQ